MTPIIQTYNAIFDKLENAGISKILVNSILPEHYKKSKSDEENVIVQTCLYLSKYLSIDAKSLLDYNQKDIKFNLPQIKYKLCNYVEKDVKPATLVILPLVKSILFALNKSNSNQIVTVKSIRDNILSKNSYINFYNLVDFCWSIGIPIIFIDSLPAGLKKMQGMCLSIDDKYAIVLTKKQPKSAWYLFALAHELGHIINNHLSNSQIIVDEEINFQSNDEKEIKANETAIEIITGNQYTSYGNSRTSYRGLDGKMLADIVNKMSEVEKVDPGFIALNFAWNVAKSGFNPYGIVGNALKILNDKDIDSVYLNNKIKDNIDFDLLSNDSKQHLNKYLHL